MEEREFQIRSNYDHHALKTMSRALRKTFRPKIRAAARVFGWIAVVSYVLLHAALWPLGLFSLDFPGVATLLAVLILLTALLFEDDLNAWVAAASLLPGTREADTRFGPECYVVVTQATESRFRYDRIRAVVETGDSFVFLLSKKHAQQFPKAGLSSGTPEEFRGFLAEKTGLPVRRMK